MNVALADIGDLPYSMLRTTNISEVQQPAARVRVAYLGTEYVNQIWCSPNMHLHARRKDVT